MRLANLTINTANLLHNLVVIKQQAAGAQVIAMVKANAYGHGLAVVTPALAGVVDAFGVMCLDEALAIRRLGICTPCIIFEGPHQADEWVLGENLGFEWVLHHRQQVEWLLNSATTPLKLWLKVNTGMNRLGFKEQEYPEILSLLQQSVCLAAPIGLMTHFACADTPEHVLHQSQRQQWKRLIANWQGPVSACNSAALWTAPECLGTHIRPGLALYGVSPFEHLLAGDLNLKPVMSLTAGVISRYELSSHEYIGYGARYQTSAAMTVAVVGLGYGDGYPRHIQPGTQVWLNQQKFEIVGRVSMDKLVINTADSTGVQIGDLVELWGEHLPIEYVAKQAGTIPYELMCQVGPRERWLNK